MQRTTMGLVFEAFCEFLIQCLLHRAYSISSNWKIFSTEIDFLRNVFRKNGYPDQMFNSCLKRFLNSKFTKPPDSKVKDDGVETLFFTPYIGLPSIIFTRKLKSLFKKYYGIDLRIVFTTFKVKNYFSLKCRSPLPLVANVVYKFQGLCDTDCIYIGKTMRHLATRVKEHGTSASAIHDHLRTCDPCRSKFSIDNFQILDRGKSDFEISVKEALHIKSKKPMLNKQLAGTQGSCFSLSIF